jgi:hypothetical protein
VTAITVTHCDGRDSADRAAAHTVFEDPVAVGMLLNALQAAGATEQITALLARDPASHAPLDDPAAVVWLLNALRAAGATEQITTLADRAAAHTVFEDPVAVRTNRPVLGWGRVSVRAHGEDGVGSDCGADHALLAAWLAGHRARWVGARRSGTGNAEGGRAAAHGRRTSSCSSSATKSPWS